MKSLSFTSRTSPRAFCPPEAEGSTAEQRSTQGQPVGTDRLQLAKEHSGTSHRWLHAANWVRLSQEAQGRRAASAAASACCLLGAGPSPLPRRTSLSLTSSCKAEALVVLISNARSQKKKRYTKRPTLLCLSIWKKKLLVTFQECGLEWTRQGVYSWQI